MKPLNIISGHQLDTIPVYLDEINVDLESKSVVPLGYDWWCLKTKCSFKFQSLSDRISKDITVDLLQRLDSLNLLNKQFSW